MKKYCVNSLFRAIVVVCILILSNQMLVTYDIEQNNKKEEVHYDGRFRKKSILRNCNGYNVVITALIDFFLCPSVLLTAPAQKCFIPTHYEKVHHHVYNIYRALEL